MSPDDIYRASIPRTTSIQSLSTHASSSSSSTRAGLGVLAAVVEHAITRWARRRSSSASSTSSRSSNVTTTRSAKRSRRRRYSPSSRSERDFDAHIALVKARKEARQDPRQFSLYLPPLHEHTCVDGVRPLTVTDSLSLVLDRLDPTLKKPIKIQRAQQDDGENMLDADLMSVVAAVDAESASQIALMASRNRNWKGKGRSISLPPAPAPAPKLEIKTKLRSKAWYLDVASPSWEDLRTLGKLLHLHPLTLEDILQREPREKLELFPRLGYYFVSFRAIETKRTHDQTPLDDINEATLDDTHIGEANVYVTVFKHGICTFHYTDISEHTRRVINRMNHLDGVFNLSSDWIAYEMLDSIVDSFFPYLDEIEKEVMEIDKLVFSRGNQHSSREADLPSKITTILGFVSEKSGQVTSNEKEQNTSNEKDEKPVEKRILVASIKIRILESWRRTRRLASHVIYTSGDNITQNSKVTLRRIARTRRLVTSLSRLLATKYEVVAQIRKRFLIDRRSGMNIGSSRDSADIAMYIGDVQDHIYTLQHSLAHYEHMLSQVQPTYLSQLRMDVELSRSGKGMALLYLYVITVAVLCIQSYVGIFSLNVNLPHNTRDPTGSYHVLGIVTVTSILILIAYFCVVRWWWKQAQLIPRTRL